MGIKIPGPQIVAFLEWLTQHAGQYNSLEEIRYSELLTFARQFRSGINITDHARQFSPEDIVNQLGVCSRVPELLRRLFSRETNNGSDLLTRYKSIRWHGIFLYTSQDVEMQSYLERHWDALSSETGDIFDFYDYSIRPGSPSAYSFTHDFVSALKYIPSIRPEAIYANGLPCLLLWSGSKYFLIPFGDVASNPLLIRERFRFVLRCMSQDSFSEIEIKFGQQVAAAVDETTDVFLSYKHSDHEFVYRLYNKLIGEGLRVWYDRNLEAGQRFDIRIHHFLKNATSAIVVWSADAIESPWVLAEALFAHSRKILVPVSIKSDLSIPPPFNAVHTEYFSDLVMDGNQDQYTRLVNQVRRRRESPVVAPVANNVSLQTGWDF